MFSVSCCFWCVCMLLVVLSLAMLIDDAQEISIVVAAIQHLVYYDFVRLVDPVDVRGRALLMQRTVALPSPPLLRCLICCELDSYRH